jgi:RNase P protein component
MKEKIQSLYDAVVGYYPHSILYNENKVEVWNMGEERFQIRIDDELVHSAQRTRIKRILKDWMEGKRELCNGFLFKKW